MMKLVHAADLHLDSPLRGLERYEGAPIEQIRGATRRALKNLVRLCVDERASLLLIAGDLYDGDWRDYSTGLFFASQMVELKETGTRVVWIRGNHDARSRIAHHLRLPDNVIELSSRRPESVHFEDLGICVHGQGFATAAVTADLAAGYPEAERGVINIGLLHTALDGREGHAPYAPCRLDALVHKGYDYWALGHVHQREILHQKPWVVFAGNLQGRHARETGPKGATLITVERGRIDSVEHRALDEVRFARCEVDASGASSPDEILERAEAAIEGAVQAGEGRLVAARVVVSGATRAHAALGADPEQLVQEIRAAAIGARGAAWVEKVELRTRPEQSFELLRKRDDPVGALLRSLEQIGSNDEALGELGAELAELRRKLPAELREVADGLGFDDPRAIRALLDDVRDLLLPRLEAEERGA